MWLSFGTIVASANQGSKEQLSWTLVLRCHIPVFFTGAGDAWVRYYLCLWCAVFSCSVATAVPIDCAWWWWAHTPGGRWSNFLFTQAALRVMRAVKRCSFLPPFWLCSVERGFHKNEEFRTLWSKIPLALLAGSFRNCFLACGSGCARKDWMCLVWWDSLGWGLCTLGLCKWLIIFCFCSASTAQLPQAAIIILIV